MHGASESLQQLSETLLPNEIVEAVFIDLCGGCETRIVPGDKVRLVDQRWVHFPECRRKA